MPRADERWGDGAGRQDERDGGPRPAVDQPRGEQRQRDPHDLEVFVHVELDGAGDDRIGDDEHRDGPGEEPETIPQLSGQEGKRREDQRDSQVRDVEEGDGGGPVAERRLGPAGHEAEGAAAGLQQHRAHDERQAQDERGEERDGIRCPARLPPDPPRERVEQDDEIDRREKEEVERREERGQQSGDDHPGAIAAHRHVRQEHGRHEDRQPECRGPVRQEARAKDGGDLEERPVGEPVVVVGNGREERRKVALAR